MKSSLTVPTAIVLAGIILALAVYMSVQPRTAPSPSGDTTLVRPVGPNDHILGNPAAKVVIVEYSDFQCEFCKGFHDTLHKVIASEGADGDVAWVFRQFPLAEIHENALTHALASECVAKVAGNDMFWKFADALFANQPVDPSEYGTLAAGIGISGSEFATCYATESATMGARILSDRQNALAVGAKGTPYSLILVAGKAPIVMDGAYSYGAAKELVDQALAN
jgi:protein-disulfide isomerase